MDPTISVTNDRHGPRRELQGSLRMGFQVPVGVFVAGKGLLASKFPRPTMEMA